MARRSDFTPNSTIRAALRRMWLRSRERASAMKREKYCCERCGAKQSRAKGREVYVEVHHKNRIDWGDLVDDIRRRLLQTPDDLEVLCKDCHKKEHASEKK